MATLPAVDMDYVAKLVMELVNTPSPSGYSAEVMRIVDRELAALGLDFVRTNRGARIATLDGMEQRQQRLLSGHVDTLGGMVKEIKPNGRLRYVPTSGGSPHSVEGEYCTVITDGGRRFTGTVLTTKESSHVYGPEGVNIERKLENMEIRLDENVKNAEQVRALGIHVGDFIAWDPRAVLTPAGYIKSRHLDDKASVAAILGAVRCLLQHGLTPAVTTHIFITNFEEVGHGAAFGTPAAVREFIAVDMGCVGEGIQATEHDVSICAKDSSGPYDADLKRKLVALATEHGIPHAVDIYPYYGSDASAALRGGADIQAIVIGPGVDASHSYERTHLDGIRATADLLVAYLLT